MPEPGSSHASSPPRDTGNASPLHEAAAERAEAEARSGEDEVRAGDEQNRQDTSDRVRTSEDARAAEREHAIREAAEDDSGLFPFGRPGHPLRRSSPFVVGFTGALGVLLAIGLTQALSSSRSVLVLIVVSLFLAVGLNPAVEWLQRHNMRRSFAVLCVFMGVVLFFVGFGFAVAPPLTEQTTAFVGNAPDYLAEFQENRTVQRLDSEFGIIDRLTEFVSSDRLAKQAFGGIVGVSKVVLSAAFSALTVLILTLYFLSSLPSIKRGCMELVPQSRRRRVELLTDEILTRIGGYVSGAILVATGAGLTTFVFLEIVGLRDFAVALSLVVGLFALIPMIGATLGAVIVTLVGFAQSVPLGIACLIFFTAYQQVENYVIYPRVMRRTVDVPPALTVVAALVGGTLLGVVGALLAIPTAAAALLIVREVVVPRQEKS